jgi:hypothetical protein
MEIRTVPPENLQRVPGPEAILFVLHRDASLTDAQLLRQAGCIEEDRRRKTRQ